MHNTIILYKTQQRLEKIMQITMNLSTIRENYMQNAAETRKLYACSCGCITKLRRLTVFLIIFIESRKTARNRIYRYLEPVTITGISEIVTSNLCFT